MKNREKHLYYLEELSDYKVATNYSDVRGWSVKDSDNRVIGEVDNLLVNKDLDRVVYLDVEVDSTIIEADHDPYGKPENTEVREFVNKEGENHIIVPIGLIDINEDRKFVYTSTINHQTFAETKRIKTGENIDRKYEETVLRTYDRDSDRDGDRDRDVNRDRNEESNDNIRKKGKSTSKREYDKELEKKEREEERLEDKRQDVAGERGELKEERKKLEEERLKLDEERQRKDSELPSNKKSETRNSRDEEGRNNLESNSSSKTSQEDHSREDDSFYDRAEFDGSNYRKKE